MSRPSSVSKRFATKRSSPPTNGASAAPADEVIFLNGDRLTGKITSAAKGRLTIRTEAAGNVTIDLKQVRTFSTDAPVTLRVGDATFTSTVTTGPAGAVQAATAPGDPPRPIPLAALTHINPPPTEWRGSLAATGLFCQGVANEHCAAILFGHGDGNFDEPDYIVAGPTDPDASVIVAGQFNNDVWPDLAVITDASRELTLLLGEPQTVSDGELQRELGRLIHGEKWETTQVPKALAKTGAWLQDNLPLVEEPFIKPWMIDLADDHYALDITRAQTLLGWEPMRSLRETLPNMVSALKSDPLGFYETNQLEAPTRLEESVASEK